MKKILITIIAAFITVTGFSQITLLDTNINCNQGITKNIEIKSANNGDTIFTVNIDSVLADGSVYFYKFSMVLDSDINSTSIETNIIYESNDPNPQAIMINNIFVLMTTGTTTLTVTSLDNLLIIYLLKTYVYLNITIDFTDVGVGLESLFLQDMPDIKIFPNPCSNGITVKGGILTKIFDMNGRLLVETFEKYIDISNFSPGIYIVNVDGVNSKLIKN